MLAQRQSDALFTIKTFKFVERLAKRYACIRINSFRIEIICFDCLFVDLQVELLYPQPLYVEIDAEKLWRTVLLAIENAIKG